MQGSDLVYVFQYDGLNRWWGYSAIVKTSASNQEAMDAALKQQKLSTYGFKIYSLQDLKNTASSQSAQAKSIAPNSEIFSKLEALSSLIENGNLEN
jgi:hypothetical protein